VAEMWKSQSRSNSDGGRLTILVPTFGLVDRSAPFAGKRAAQLSGRSTQFLSHDTPENLLQRFSSLLDIFPQSIIDHCLVISSARPIGLIPKPCQDIVV
jgi:hypothetical protein